MTEPTYRPYTVWVEGKEILPRGGWHSTDISPLVRFGFTEDEAVEMLNHRQAGRSAYVALLTRGLVAGIPRNEVDEALETNRPAVQNYMDLRAEGVGHADAIERIRDLHVCQPAETRQIGALNPVLGTGEVTRITVCACGTEMWRDTTRRNWSGD